MLRCYLLTYPCTLDDLLKFNEIVYNVQNNGSGKFDDTMMMIYWYYHPIDHHSGNVVKLNKWLKVQVIIHTLLSLQYNIHSFNILSYPSDLLCFIIDVPCAISEIVNG